MSPFRRLPLAWKNLTHDYRRLSVAVGGIAFAVLLMFMQTGFRNALLDSTVKIVADLDADIVIVNKALYAIPTYQRFDLQRIRDARTCRGVQSVRPLYIEAFFGVLRNPGQKGHSIRVLACDPNASVFRYPQVAQHARQLEQPHTALIDTRSKAKFGVPHSDPRRLHKYRAELGGRRVRFVGTFQLGTDFANDGNVFMSTHNFARYFPFRAGAGREPLELVDMGVVRVETGEDVMTVKRRLESSLPIDVAVLTKDELSRNEYKFWNESTPVGYIFTVGTIMGFVIGVIICYQIIYANIADHMAEFATLKAMGYNNGYFIGVVLRKALYLSIMGFIPGLLVSIAIYQGLAYYTGLLMIITVPRAAFVYVLTLVMCVVSGCLAVRKVLSADPAELF